MKTEDRPGSGSGRDPLRDWAGPRPLWPRHGPPDRIDLGHGVVEIRARRFVPADGGPPVPLTQREVDLLAYLSRHPGRMIGRDELAREVWSEAPEVATRTVDTAIHRLRSKLETPSSEPRVLLGGVGEGLRLNLGLQARTAAEAAIPRSVGPLVGREAELDELLGLLDAGAELVTVVGEEGVGKSRLAAEVALRLGAHPAGGGARWVRLAGVRTAATLRHAVGAALDVDWVPGEDPDERIRAAMVDTVLVLDGLNAPIDAAAELVPRWLGAPGGRIVGTCTAPLLVPDERAVDLGPLDAAPALEMFQACASVSGREPTADEAEAVAAIVSRTRGNPMAIEIAAIWSALLDPPSVLARIEAAHAGASARADPLSVVITAAWQLLTGEERDCLVTCAAFPGRFDGRAVAAMCDGPARIPAALLALRRKGLIRSAGGRLLELPSAVRAVVGAMQREHGLAADLPARFSHHAWEVAVDLADRLVDATAAGPEEELAGAVAALGEIDDPAVGAEVLLALGPALDAAGWTDAHAEALERILREPVPADLEAALLERRASVLVALGEPEAPAAVARAAAAVARDGDPVLRALVALDEAALAGDAGRGDEVLVRTRQAADLLRAGGRRGPEEGRTGPVWMAIGANLMAAGDRAGAEAAYEEGVRDARAAGSHRRAAAAFVRLANLAIDHGDVARASARVGEAEAELRVTGSRAPPALLRVRAALAELRGDAPLAEAEWRELAALAGRADEPWARLEAQLGLARCALRRDDPEAAWDLLAAAASAARGRWVAGWVEATALLGLVHLRLGRRTEAERIRAELTAARATEALRFVAARIDGRPPPEPPERALLMVRLRHALVNPG